VNVRLWNPSNNSLRCFTATTLSSDSSRRDQRADWPTLPSREPVRQHGWERGRDNEQRRESREFRRDRARRDEARCRNRWRPDTGWVHFLLHIRTSAASHTHAAWWRSSVGAACSPRFLVCIHTALNDHVLTSWVDLFVFTVGRVPAVYFRSSRSLAETGLISLGRTIRRPFTH